MASPHAPSPAPPDARVLHVLFVCGKNRWRSPTAEAIFADRTDIACLSAGVSRDADTPVSAELIDWADLIVVMERDHQARLTARHGSHLAGKRVACLAIPDRYRFMDPELVRLLQRKVTPLLTRSPR